MTVQNYELRITNYELRITNDDALGWGEDLCFGAAGSLKQETLRRKP